MAASTSDSTYVIRRDDFDRFLSELRSLGYDVLGPSVADGAVTLGSIACAEDLPQGVGAKSSAGRYRLEERTDRALFGFGISSASVKRWLLPPRRDLWRSTLTEAGITFHATSDLPAKTAIVGLRACDLQAIEVLDGVFLGGHTSIRTTKLFEAGSFSWWSIVLSLWRPAFVPPSEEPPRLARASTSG